MATTGICEAGTKCCVSKDKYSGKLTDLRTPVWNNNASIPLNTAQLINLIKQTDAATKISKPTDDDYNKMTESGAATINIKNPQSTTSAEMNFAHDTEKSTEN